jgi:hypothetical protein
MDPLEWQILERLAKAREDQETNINLNTAFARRANSSGGTSSK